jgi:hypothetical protein
MTHFQLFNVQVIQMWPSCRRSRMSALFSVIISLDISGLPQMLDIEACKNWDFHNSD